MKYSLRWKLLGSFMLLIAILLGSVLFGISVVVKDHTRLARQAELETKGLKLANTMKAIYADKGKFVDLDDILDDADSYLGARVWLVDAQCHIVNVSQTNVGPGQGRGMGMMRGQNAGMGMMRGMNHNQQHDAMHTDGIEQNQMQSCLPDIQDVVDKALKQGESSAKLYSSRYYGQQMLVVATPIILDNGQKIGTVLLQEPYSSIETYMKDVYYYLLVAGIIAMLVALVLAYWLTQHIVHPLTAMEKAATEMAQGEYGQHLPVESQDEIGRLSKALNSLAVDLQNYINNIEGQEKLRRDFVANVSHELRTPLTILRGYDEALLTGVADTPEERHEYCVLMQEEIMRLERLIADLLDLSRLQGSGAGKALMEKEKLSLEDLAAGLLHKMQQPALKKNINLSLQKQMPSPVIWGNGDRIMQMLLIFVDNAIKYTQVGGQVTVTTLQEGNRAKVIIADNGQGIAKEDLPYVWERFYKAEKSHSRTDKGTGLGLSIAKEILTLHNGQAEITSEVGKGTTITVSFEQYIPQKQEK